MTILANYCTPARIYLGISVATLFLIIIQNLMNPNDKELCIGVYKCTMSHKIYLLVFQTLYMIFWTWFLNFLCRKKLVKLAWFILILPFLLSAVLIGAMIIAINENEKNKSEY